MTLIMYSSGVSPDSSTAALASAVALLAAPFGRPAPALLPPRGIFDFSDCTIVYHPQVQQLVSWQFHLARDISPSSYK
jgi:hypothetical protein